MIALIYIGGHECANEIASGYCSGVVRFRRRSLRPRMHIYAVGAAILHYGAENDWCEYRRIKKLKEPKPETRRPTPNALPLLLANTKGLRRLFILTIFRQGWRISETLTWREDKIDLRAMITRARSGSATSSPGSVECRNCGRNGGDCSNPSIHLTVIFAW